MPRFEFRRRELDPCRTAGDVTCSRHMHRTGILMHMRTTLNIDDALLGRATELSGLRERRLSFTQDSGLWWLRKAPADWRRWAGLNEAFVRSPGAVRVPAAPGDSRRHIRLGGSPAQPMLDWRGYSLMVR